MNLESSKTPSLKQRIREGQKVIGAWMCTPSPAFAELACSQGLDFLVVDMEHGAIDMADLPDILRGFSGACAPIVRIPYAHPSFIARALDRGAAGIMVPRVDTLTQARECARAAHYPPEGDRGKAIPMIRGSGYGLREDYRDRSNRDVFVCLQVESAQAIDILAQIATEPLVDLLFIGPTDLSANLRLEGPENHDAFWKIMDQIQRQCAQAGMAVGTIPFSGVSASALFEKGYRMVAAGSDVTMMREGLAQLRKTS
nr:2-dehydro-3,6-dideoxy-6-sulfogluconate aldolase [Cupriavidus sp.]